MDKDHYLSLISNKDLQEKIRLYISSKVFGHHNIQDLVQKTNKTLIEKHSSYKESGKIQALALTIAFWKIKEWKKKEARSKVIFDDALFTSQSNLADPNSEKTLAHAEKYELLNKKIKFVLTEVSKKSQHIFKLYMTGMKPSEIQEETGYTISVIYKTNQRIKERLRFLIKNSKL